LTTFDRCDNERSVLKIPNVHYLKMKTRQNYYSNQTYQKIIKSALKLFVKNGYHGTSISDISKAAKLTKGAIYFHFENKNALVKKILEMNDTNYLSKMIEEATSTKGKAIDKMKALLRFCLNFGVKNRELGLCLTSLSTELCCSRKKYEKDIKKVYKKFHIFLWNLLEEGKKDGSFRKDIDPDILALNLMGAMDGTLLQWNMNRNEVNGEEFSRSFMKFFLNGICK
jgi:AcrR family transcriptional regulator